MGQSPSPFPTAPALAGKKVAIVGRFIPGNNTLAELRRCAKNRGASVVTGKGTAPDFLVEVFETTGPPPALGTQIQKKFPQVQVLSRDEFQKLATLTADDVLALLRTGPHDREVWSDAWWYINWGGRPITLRGIDLRGRDLSNANLSNVRLEGVDLRGARLHQTALYNLTDCNLDGATITDAHLNGVRGCTFRKAAITNTDPHRIAGCDFSGAKVARARFSGKVKDCRFDGVEFDRLDLDFSKLPGCSFARARLPGAESYRADLSGCDLTGADLSRANLWFAKLARADLTSAAVRDAVLVRADLSGARIAGADLTGSNLTGVADKGVDWSRAKNAEPRPGAKAGPNLRKLGRLASRAKKVSTSITVALGPGESVILSVERDGRYARAGYESRSRSGATEGWADAPTFDKGMVNLADRWSGGTPRLESVTAAGERTGLRAGPLKELAVAAWCEAFGRPIPSADERAEQETSQAADRDMTLATLKAGRGVRGWNARPERERLAFGSLKGTDFSGGKMSRVQFRELDLRDARFTGANLSRASFAEARLAGAVFDGADLSGTNLTGTRAPRASFAGANLTGARMRVARLRGCSFAGADLTGADLIYADLTGADLSGAKLDGAKLNSARFDEKTALPPGFVPPQEMKWVGTGHRPRPAPVVVARMGTMTFDDLYKSLSGKVEAARIEKAVSMLKAERFQLFAEVTPGEVLGVVKSQSVEERLYSCRLGADGSFGCCTQNLKHCGGLRGAVCKHLLVLILGLAKAGRLDPATANAWVDASQSQKPEIDPDEMSEAFLRYKGAEAGRIDWRPTETIPEDFYAM